MVRFRSRVGNTSTPRVGGRPLILLGVLGFAAASCSGGGDATPVAGHPTTTTLSARDQQIVQGWRAAEESFYAASISGDPASPALAATMTNPELNQARTLLFVEQRDGYVGRGTYDLGSPRVVSETPTTAVVVSCIYGGVVEVDAKTGKPAPAPFGVAEKELERATMIEAGAGVWKESQLSVKEGTCDAS